MRYTAPMNIALFSDCYSPTKNGVVTVVMQLRTILRKMGHHVVVVTVDTSKLENGVKDNDPCVLRTPSVPLGLGTDHFIGFPHKAKILEFLKTHHVELIHSHTEFVIAHAAKVLAKTLRIPAIVTTHTMWEDFYPYYIPMGKLIPVRIVRKLTKRIYRKFYAMINVSEKAHRYFKQPFMLPNVPSAIIPNAVDTAAFEAKKDTKANLEETRRTWGIGKDDTLLLFVGRIGEEKRVFELLDICANVLRRAGSRVKVLFVGNGPALTEMKHTVRRLELTEKIIFTGFLSWDQLHTYYAMSDIFVTASLSEMHSMTILEAMISALPIVVRDDVSFHDTISDGQNGFLTASDAEMEERILELIQDSGKRRKFSKKSLEMSRKFSLETHGKKTEAFYQAVLESYPGKLDEKKLVERINAV